MSKSKGGRPAPEEVLWLLRWLLRRTYSYVMVERRMGKDPERYRRFAESEAGKRDAEVFAEMLDLARGRDDKGEVLHVGGHVLRRRDLELVPLRMLLADVIADERRAAKDQGTAVGGASAQRMSAALESRGFQLSEGQREKVRSFQATHGRGDLEPADVAADLLARVFERSRATQNVARTYLKRKWPDADLRKLPSTLLTFADDLAVGPVPGPWGMMQFLLEDVLGYGKTLAAELLRKAKPVLQSAESFSSAFLHHRRGIPDVVSEFVEQSEGDPHGLELWAHAALRSEFEECEPEGDDGADDSSA